MQDSIAIISSSVALLLLSIHGCAGSNESADEVAAGGSLAGSSAAGAAGASDADNAGAAGTNEDATLWLPADGGNGHRYLLVTAENGITWSDANAAASAAGGYLATIATGAENAFVLALVQPVAAAWVAFPPNTTHLGPWLGAHAEAASWSWVTSEPWGYTGWINGQPSSMSNTGEVEDKLQLLALDDPNSSAEVGWNDATDWAGPSYVIEFE